MLPTAAKATTLQPYLKEELTGALLSSSSRRTPSATSDCKFDTSVSADLSEPSREVGRGGGTCVGDKLVGSPDDDGIEVGRSTGDKDGKNVGGDLGTWNVRKGGHVRNMDRFDVGIRDQKRGPVTTHAR